MLEDDYVLRRRAVELGIPLFTSLATLSAYVEGVAWLEEHPLTVEPLYGAPEPGGAPVGRPFPRRIPVVPRRRRGGR
jgi:hypothetical protein